MTRRILAVDDTATVRLLVGRALREAGFEVSEAADGAEALARAEAEAEPFHMVLADVHMPRLGGIELVRALRALPRYRQVPVVMLTTESDEASRQAAREAGASGWIAKPVRVEQIVDVAKRLAR